MYYPVGETINDHISAEVIESVKGYAAKIGLDLTLYERCKPWVWLTLFEMRALNQLGLKTDLGIDNRLITQAKEDGKEIIELESTAFQMDLLTGYTDEICELLLAPYTADNADAYSEDLAQTYEAWKNGDFEFFEKSYSKAGQLQDQRLVVHAKDGHGVSSSPDRRIVAVAPCPIWLSITASPCPSYCFILHHIRAILNRKW